jgi:hypothetical protein
MPRKRTLRLLVAALALVLPALVAAPAARADSPLPTPTNLQALHVSDTAADLDWTSSGLSGGDVVQRYVGGAWTQYATGTYGYLALTGLTPGATYTFRVYSTAIAGLGDTASAPSAPLAFTTLSAPDSVPPAKPGAPTFSQITTTQAGVFWPQTTDNVQVTGYHLQQLVGGAWTTIRTVAPNATSQTVSGLAPSTAYSFAVIAFDARGNQSARSDAGTFTTLAFTAQPKCVVQTNSYGNGFQVTATLTNTTAAPLTGWSVQFSLPASATVNSVFSSVLTRNGSVDTLTAAAYDTTIGTGAFLYVGFSGSDSPFVAPSGFALNGIACSAA